MAKQVRVVFPMPFENCPGRTAWEKYRGEEWLVFVDESFFMFFELTAKSGYFGHAAVGIPEREYAGLKAAVAPIFQDYVRLTGQNSKEFKHTEFKRLEFRERRKLALRLRDAMVRHGAMVAGFYTPVRPLVLERVRFDIMDGAEEIPEDHQALFDKAVTELLAEHKRPGQAGQSGVIRKLLWLATAAISNVLGTFECGFKVYCDPREKKEDKLVRASIDDQVVAFGRVSERVGLGPDTSRYFRGIEGSKQSEEEIGLQLADLMVGELCAFFAAYPELMSHGATRRLVTATSEEPLITVTKMDGRVFKSGAILKMPAALQARFSRPDARTVLPLFRNLFASGMLTTYSSWGQPRDLMPFVGLIEDQTD